MKTISTFFLCFTAFIALGQNTFRTGISALTYTSLLDVKELSDGSYIGVGFTEKDSNNVNYGDYAYLVKLNAQGRFVSAKSLGATNGYAKAFRLIATSDRNVAVSGILNSQIALYKFDTDLNVLWYKSFVVSNSQSRATKVLQTSDGGYMIAGSADQIVNSVALSVGVVIKTDNNGNINWSKQYFDLDFNFNRYKYITDLVNTNDGNYAFVRQSYNSSVSTNPFIMDTSYLVKINGNGSILWSTYITGIQTITSLLSASDGSLIICGYNHIRKLFTDGSPDDYTYIIKFGAVGNLVWSKTRNQDSHSFGLVESKDGNYLLTESIYFEDTHSSGFGYQGYITEINKDGSDFNSISSFGLPTQYVNQIYNGISSTKDGGYVIAGNISSPGDLNNNTYNDGLVFKIDSSFNYCNNTDGLFNNTSSFATLNVSTGQKTAFAYDISPLISTEIATISTIGMDSSFCNSVLPLQLLSFKAILLNKSVFVEWRTNNEINTDYFIVERSNSSNLSMFKTLQKVAAFGSNSIKTYSINDNLPLPGTSYYRLLQVDKNGKSQYSSIVSVTIKLNGDIIIFPNPVNSYVNLKIQSNVSGKANLQVADITGKVLLQQQKSIMQGENSIAIPASSLTKGIYVLKVIQDNFTKSIKFIKE